MNGHIQLKIVNPTSLGCSQMYVPPKSLFDREVRLCQVLARENAGDNAGVGHGAFEDSYLNEWSYSSQ